LAFKLVVLRDGALRLFYVVEHYRVDETPDIEIGIAEAIEPDERADPVVGVAGHDGDVAVAGLIERPLRHRLEFECETEAAARENAALTGEHHRLRERAQSRLGVDDTIEPVGVDAEEGGLAVEIA